jgi:hypothetical protein
MRTSAWPTLIPGKFWSIASMDAASDWAWPDCDEIKQAMHAIIEMLRIDVVVPKNGASL